MVRRVELRAEGGEEADRAAAHAAVQLQSVVVGDSVFPVSSALAQLAWCRVACRPG